VALADARPIEAFFDDDCGFCSACADVVQRLAGPKRVRLTPVSAASQLYGLDEPALRAVFHVRDDKGTWHRGAAGWVVLARAVPLLRPLAALASLPGLRIVADRTYALVSRNRHGISRMAGLDACPVPGATPKESGAELD